MTERATARLSNQILDEATSWFVEFNETTQDERTREAFHEWLRTSPEHVRAFLQIAAHWEDDARRPRAASESDAVESIDELLAMARLDTNIVPLMLKPEEPRRVAHADSSPSAVRPAEGKPIRRVAFALAASVLVTLASLSAWLITQRNVYSTSVGEQRSLRLEDGSTVEINARSRIAIRYSERERHIDLLDGQALFHVAKSKTRPFIVQSGPTRIQAVGTQFDVYRKKSGTVVTVVEGRVAVTSPSPANSSGTAHPKQASAEEISAGQQLTISPTAAAQPQAANVVVATAWTQRRLIFARAAVGGRRGVQPLQRDAARHHRSVHRRHRNQRHLLLQRPHCAAALSSRSRHVHRP